MEQTNNIYAALARAQATYSSAQKNGYNPHYKSSFSTFEDLVLASRESLTREGISVTQYLHSEDDKEYLITLLMHSSGEIIKSKGCIYVKDRTDIQKFGSAMTYLKRYVYGSICGIATSEHDDDAQQTVTEPFISDKQVWLIRSFLKGDNDLEEKICKHYGVTNLKDMPAKYVNQIVDKLKSKE